MSPVVVVPLDYLQVSDASSLDRCRENVEVRESLSRRPLCLSIRRRADSRNFAECLPIVSVVTLVEETAVVEVVILRPCRMDVEVR